MKISSASKKVLASALSAAMVVAFAPTVAFGAVAAGQTVTVKFDTTGLTLNEGSSAISDVTVEATQVAGNGNENKVSLALDASVFSGHAYKNVTSWWVDANGNNSLDEGESVEVTGGTLTLPKSVDLEAGAITLKPVVGTDFAVAGVPANGSGTVAQKATANQNFLSFTIGTAAVTGSDVSNLYTIAGDTAAQASGNAVKGTVYYEQDDNGDVTATLNSQAKKFKKADVTYPAAAAGASTYAISVSKDGQEISSQTKAVDAGGTVVFKFKDSADMTAEQKAAGFVDVASYGKGSYTVTIKDLLDTKKSVTKSFDIVAVTLSGVFTDDSYDHASQTVLALKKADVYTAINSATGINTIANPKTVNNAPVNATGYYYNGKKVAGITSGTTLNNTGCTAVKAEDGMVLDVVYADQAVATAGYANKTITASAANLENGKTYKAVLSGAVSKESAKATASNSAADFHNLYSWGDATPAAGDYTVTIYKVETAGSGDAASELTTKVAEATVSIATVTLDAGEGKLSAGNGKLGAFEAGTAYSAVIGAVTANPTDSTKAFLGWSLDGATVLKSTDKIAKGEDVTLKAVYGAAKVALPAFSYADGFLTLSTEAGAGYKIQYQIGASGSWVDYTGAIKVDPKNTSTINAKVVKTTTGAGLNGSGVLVLTNSTATKSSLVTFKGNLFGSTTTSDSTTSKPKYYSVELKAAADAAEKAITDIAYDTADGWGKTLFNQEKALVDAVAAYETAQVDALAAGVTNSDGSVSKVSDTAAAKAKADIEKVVADFVASYDDDKATTPSKVRALGAYATDIQKAAKNAAGTAVKYAKADVDAAKAVSDQLKAAKTGAEAKAAVEAYNKLTSTQKELVAAADVAAAQEIVSKAEADEAAKALIEAQDEAAIAAVKGKTVKAKAKKKTTSSLKVVTSKSGAKSTFAKTSGNAKITVSKGGKITVKKGLKAGKTYKAKVKATVGTQTKTVTVTVKVR